MNLRLDSKTAIVCGSTQGIGFECAKSLAKLGANVILLARNEEKLKACLTQLENNGKQTHDYLVADLSQPTELQKNIQSWNPKINNCHILINNSGGPKGGKIVDAELEEFTSTFNQHLLSSHVLMQHFVPQMKEAGYGRIINIISTSVKQPLDNLGVSNTIRAAVANWSKTLANELGQFNITVNNVLPGATNTDRLRTLANNKVTEDKTVQDVLNAMGNESPMKRIAEPQEVANAVVFLASPAASYINGINIPVDGGRTKSL